MQFGSKFFDALFFSKYSVVMDKITYGSKVMNALRRILVVSLLAVFSWSTASHGETVTTTDGRTIILNEDGTYAIEADNTLESEKYLSIGEPLFEHHVSIYKQKSVRFIPKVKNITDDIVAGVRFSASFQDAFGEEVFRFDGDLSERIQAGKTSKADVFYVFEDNQFISGEPYDKLLPMVSGNTGKVVTIITGIAFDNGEVLKF